MSISEEIKANHLSLSRANLTFLEYATQNLEYQRESNFRKMDLEGYFYKLHPWPTFVNRKSRMEMETVSRKVFDLLRKIPGIFQNDPRQVARFYGVPDELARYFIEGVDDFDLDILVGRGDFIIADDDVKYLEYNVNTNIGGLEIPLWESKYFAVPQLTEYYESHNIEFRRKDVCAELLEHLARTQLERFPERNQEVNIAIPISNYISKPQDNTKSAYFNSIYCDVRRKLDIPSGQIVFCSYHDLKQVGDHVFVNDKPVFTIMEWCQGFVPLHLWELFKEGKIILFNGPISWMLSSKSNLALFSEMEDSPLLTAEEQDTVRRHIPWTRNVEPGSTRFEGETIDMETLLIQQREKMVLKPALGSGGRGIVVGKFTPPAQWETVVKSALNSRNWRHLEFEIPRTEGEWHRFSTNAQNYVTWTVQEYVDSKPLVYQSGYLGFSTHRTVWGFILFGSRYAGGLVRALPERVQEGVINCHQGAKLSVMFEVEEE
jgi:hypothetical protein